MLVLKLLEWFKFKPRELIVKEYLESKIPESNVSITTTYWGKSKPETCWLHVNTDCEMYSGFNSLVKSLPKIINHYNLNKSIP